MVESVRGEGERRGERESESSPAGLGHGNPGLVPSFSRSVAMKILNRPSWSGLLTCAVGLGNRS